MTIAGEGMPVRPVQPVPAVQVSRTGIRTIPEVTACAASPQCVYGHIGVIPSCLWQFTPDGLISIAGEGKPARPAQPVPAEQGSRTGSRTIPEETAL